MPVYLIRAGDTEFVKIGWADRNVDSRRAELQCAHYEELHIVRTLQGSQLSERWLHHHFRDRHVRGEWFRYCPEMLTATPPLSAPKAKKSVHIAATRIIEVLGDTAEVAKALGVGRSAVSNMKTRGLARSKLLAFHQLAAGHPEITAEIITAAAAPDGGNAPRSPSPPQPTPQEAA